MKFLIILLLFISTLFTNELKNSTSPYLLQHKNNPVNWMEWSDRAFRKAKKQNKLIFLSIGYSTCHWCHVMAKESFSQKDVAKVLNRYFVSIKVDKERKSDIDSYYQLGFRLVNNRGGGWPLTVILLPNKKPIFFATYMPKDALLNLLNQIVNTKREKLEKIANSIDRAIKEAQNTKLPPVKIPHNLANKAISGFKAIYDNKNYGFSIEPKFPQASSINTLLNLYEITKNKDALNMAINTLKAMAKGGVYDQIEGGFFRYSIDRAWQIPHFEKMLYTNAELISAYSKAYKITKNPLFARVVKESIANIEKYFNYKGLYFSASNADSKDENKEEKEGYYYIFDYERALEYLINSGISKKEAKEALDYFGIESMGNFDGGEYSHAHIKSNTSKYTKIKKLLANLRAKKEYPFIDKKINTAWNALYIKALFDASVVDKNFTNIATNRLDNLLQLMYKNRELYHQTLLPNKPKQLGLLEDYSFVANALFSAYQNTLNSKYLELYNEVVKKSVNLFYKNGNWYLNRDKTIKASFDDGSYKSAAALMVENILKYVAISGDYSLLKVAKKSIKNSSYYLAKAPQYYPTLLNSVLLKKEELYIIKGKKEPLLELNLEDILYPYLYKKADKLKGFQICGLQSCYSTLKNIKRLKKELEILIKK